MAAAIRATDQAADRPVVCVLDPVHPAALARLAERAEVRVPPHCDDWPASADAVIVRNTEVGGAEIARAGRLRVIGKHGAGTDNIDVEAAAAAGVAVLATPGANAASVADLAVGMALALIRNIHGHSAALKAGRPLAGAARRGHELAELPAGIIGLGAIGGAVARRLHFGFGAPVAAIDPAISAADWPDWARRHHDHRSLMAESRLVFVHIPLTPANRDLIDAAMLRAMPKGSFLVNCARGGIVDETALADLLRSGHLHGAASDVFDVEPPEPEHPLLGIGSFLATPHIGASTEGGLRRVGLAIADKVLAGLAAHPAREAAPQPSTRREDRP